MEEEKNDGKKKEAMAALKNACPIASEQQGREKLRAFGETTND
jgi:ribosomal protein S7